MDCNECYFRRQGDSGPVLRFAKVVGCPVVEATHSGPHTLQNTIAADAICDRAGKSAMQRGMARRSKTEEAGVVVADIEVTLAPPYVRYFSLGTCFVMTLQNLFPTELQEQLVLISRVSLLPVTA